MKPKTNLGRELKKTKEKGKQEHTTGRGGEGRRGEGGTWMDKWLAGYLQTAIKPT